MKYKYQELPEKEKKILFTLLQEVFDPKYAHERAALYDPLLVLERMKGRTTAGWVKKVRSYNQILQKRIAWSEQPEVLSKEGRGATAIRDARRKPRALVREL